MVLIFGLNCWLGIYYLWRIQVINIQLIYIYFSIVTSKLIPDLRAEERASLKNNLFSEDTIQLTALAEALNISVID